jgi:hypothetical protein
LLHDLMSALALPLVVALAISGLTHGQLSRLRHARFEGTLLVFAALAAQILLFSPVLESRDWAIRLGPSLYVASMMLVLLVVARNVRLQLAGTCRMALGGAALGVLLNCIVVAANGGYMPRVAADGYSAVPMPSEVGRLVNVTPMTADTPLLWLGDVFEEPSWLPNTNILSIGDILLSTGLASWAFALTRGPAARPVREGARLDQDHS